MNYPGPTCHRYAEDYNNNNNKIAEDDDDYYYDNNTEDYNNNIADMFGDYTKYVCSISADRRIHI
jgi:hypothetical protein